MARKVAVIMGSKSDWATMQAAVEILEQMGVEYHTEVVSAHRTPQKLTEFAETAVDKGYAVIIAGAGGAAHLPGMVAAHTRLPVLGVPGWWAANEDAAFYSDASVFRAPRQPVEGTAKSASAAGAP